MFDFFFQVKELIVSKTAKDSATIFIGNVLSSVLGIVFTILAARFLGPENWGLVAAVGSLIIILVAVGDFGLGAGIFRFASGLWNTGKISQAERIYRTVFSMRLVTAIVIAVLLILLAPWISQTFLRSSDSTLVFLAAVGVFGTLLLDFQIVSMQARQSWKIAAIFLALTNLLRVLLTLFLVSIDAVNLYSILTVFSGSLLIIWAISYFWRPSLPQLGEGWRKTIREVAPFSGWMAGNKIVSSINSRVDVLLLVTLTGAYDAGIYAAANRLVLGVPLILGSFATVLAPRFASIDGRQELLDFFKKAIGLSVLIAILLAIGVLIAPLVISLFGESYRDSGSVLQWLLIGFIPFVLSTPSVNVLIYHFQKPQVITLLSLFQLPLILVLNFYGIPRFGVFGPVITLGIVNLLTFFVTAFFAWQYLRRL
ncbi:MAG: oligosaccharide flippase family protein [Candidatus Blackburnbacteria bacterium]|nr:oligosaccharide flippase family protein [Candidatus Blackburnbacteria bacterium]